MQATKLSRSHSHHNSAPHKNVLSNMLPINIMYGNTTRSMLNLSPMRVTNVCPNTGKQSSYTSQRCRSAMGVGPAGYSGQVRLSSTGSSLQALAAERVQTFQGLTSDDFRHPLDLQNTSLLRAIPGLELIAQNIMGPVLEQVLVLENLSTSIKIGPQQLPSIHTLLTDAARILQMDAPELYIRQSPVPNAYTLAISGRKPFIVIHTALIELLTPLELQAVLAHELGHLKCNHGLWLTVANVIGSGAVSMLPAVNGLVTEGLMRWLRAAELTCDRAALLVTQDTRVIVSALMKLAGGAPSFAGQLNVDAFLEQARSYEEASSSVLGWYLRNAQTSGLSHPLPVLRAREIDRWGQGPEFQALLAKNRLPRGPKTVAGQQQLRSLGTPPTSALSSPLRQPL